MLLRDKGGIALALLFAAWIIWLAVREKLGDFIAIASASLSTSAREVK